MVKSGQFTVRWYDSSMVRQFYGTAVQRYNAASGDNLIMKDGKYEHFVEKFNMNTLQQIESLKSVPDPASFRYILTGHYGVVKH
jgi:hypothetical protein